MESTIANTHSHFELFQLFLLELPPSGHVSFPYLIFLALDANFVTVCSLSHNNLPAVEANNFNLSTVQHNTILFFNDIQSNACGRGRLSSLQSFRDLASSIVWFHCFLGLQAFQCIICNWPKVGKEREYSGYQEGCLDICLKEVNTISLARHNIIASPNCR